MAIAVAVVGVLASVTNGKLGRSSELILKDNYRSVLAAQRMKEAIERIDSAALFIVAGEQQAGVRQSDEYIPRFERELVTQEGNVTETGEQAATHALRARWDKYLGRLRLFMEPHDEASHRRLYFEQLQPSFVEVKEGAEMILVINQDAMVRKSEQARKMARQLDGVMIVAAVAACVLGLLSSVALTTRILRPLGVLRFAARRLGEGDPKARALVHGRERRSPRSPPRFNTMASRLAQYRASSLGASCWPPNSKRRPSSTACPTRCSCSIPMGGLHRREPRDRDQPARAGRRRYVRAAGAGAARGARADRGACARYVMAGRGSYQSKGLEEALRTTLGDQEAFVLPRRDRGVDRGRRDHRRRDPGLQDVTRLMRFDELKSNLVATVAHEFRTPLTSLRMALHLCLEQVVGPITEKQADLL